MFQWLSEGNNLKGLGTVMGGLGSIGGGIMEYKLGKDALDFQKNAFNTQYADHLNQRKKNENAVGSVYGGLGSYSGTV